MSEAPPDESGSPEPEALSLFDLDSAALAPPPMSPASEPSPASESSAEPEPLPAVAITGATSAGHAGAEESPAPSAAPTPARDQHSPSPPVDEPPVGNLLDGIVGQPLAVDRLRSALESPLPAYLFVGPAGAGLRDAACRFAGELLAATSATPERERRLALADQHPDLLVIDRVGPAMTAQQARDAVRAAAIAPATNERKVIVLCDTDRAATTAPILLKSVEEPPPSSVFLLLAEEVNRSMETLASRCVRIDFEALSETDLTGLLVDQGIDADRAAFSARAAAGSIDRARLLASDDAAAARIETWSALRSSLNGTASTAMVAADTALAAVEQATEPLEARHTAERAEADEQAELYGTNARRGAIDERHRRELRRQQIDELAMGLGVLSAQIRDDAGAGKLSPGEAAEALTTVADAAEALRFNANARLALQRLFVRLGRLQMPSPMG